MLQSSETSYLSVWKPSEFYHAANRIKAWSNKLIKCFPLSNGLWTSFVLSKQEKQLVVEVLSINCTPGQVLIKPTAEHQLNYCYFDISQWFSNKSLNKACIAFTNWSNWQSCCPSCGAVCSGFNLGLNAYAFLCSLSSSLFLHQYISSGWQNQVDWSFISI